MTMVPHSYDPLIRMHHFLFEDPTVVHAIQSLIVLTYIKIYSSGLLFMKLKFLFVKYYKILQQLIKLLIRN